MAKVSKLKKVNIYANTTIHGTAYPPIHGLKMGLMMTDADIKLCLEKGASVFEVLPENKTRKIELDSDKKELSFEELDELTRPDSEKKVEEKSAVISTKSSFIKEPESKSAESSETI